MSSSGAPDVKCEHPACRRKACSIRTIPGVASECVCEVCGFRWSGIHGTDARGHKWLKDPKRGWQKATK